VPYVKAFAAAKEAERARWACCFGRDDGQTEPEPVGIETSLAGGAYEIAGRRLLGVAVRSVAEKASGWPPSPRWSVLNADRVHRRRRMLRGVFTLGALLVGGLVALAVASAVLLPILSLVTTLLVAAIKLAFFLAVIYFIVKLISPETADRALSKLRSKVRRAA